MDACFPPNVMLMSEIQRAHKLNLSVKLLGTLLVQPRAPSTVEVGHGDCIAVDGISLYYAMAIGCANVKT